MKAAREEAASFVMNKEMYVLGGIVEKELYNGIEKYQDDEWTEVAQLDEARAKFCAVALPDGSGYAVLGKVFKYKSVQHY